MWEEAQRLLVAAAVEVPLPRAEREALVSRVTHRSQRGGLPLTVWQDIARMSYRQMRRLRKGSMVEHDRQIMKALTYLRNPRKVKQMP